MPSRLPRLCLARSAPAGVLSLVVAACSCGDPDPGADGGARDAASDATRVVADTGPRGDAGPPPRPQTAELWYSVDDLLVRIELDASDGTVAALTESRLIGDLPVGQNALTMLDSGALLGARLGSDDATHFYFVATPPDTASDVTPILLGVVPDDLMLEALYSDCNGRIYAMDTGADDTDAIGNRLLRFTGDVLAGDFAYVVISDLSTAAVADIDDMSPGITGNVITDNPGFAIDTGHIHAFDYVRGTGTEVALGGTYGIHALGGMLFDDGTSRLYVLSSDAELHEVDPTTFELSEILTTGPTPDEGIPGWSGLAGPLTDCDTGFLI
jgi:hypothetical protein